MGFQNDVTLKCGQYIHIQSFKHDGSLHRTWTMGMVIHADDDGYTIVTNKSWVIESDGRTWLTREPALWFFYPDQWFNICAMIRRDGIYYYCNLASPALFDGEALKYIDYDLDYKLYPDGRYMLLDNDEFLTNSDMMHYSEDIQQIILHAKNKLSQWIESYHPPFDDRYVLTCYDRYLDLKANLSRIRH